VGEREGKGGSIGFSSLMKFKKKGGNYAVFYFTGERFFFNEVFVKQKIKNALLITTAGGPISQKT
jgi:hypothetical protein